MPCSCETPKDIPITPGTKVHEKKIMHGSRLNSECPSWVQYIGPHHAIVRYYNKRTGEFISEHAFTRAEFNEQFEACPSQDPEPLEW